MNTPRVLLPTISCSETMTTLGLAVRSDHRYWNVSYTIIDFASFVVACTPSREQKKKCFTVNSEKLGNDDDNDNGNGDDGLY